MTSLSGPDPSWKTLTPRSTRPRKLVRAYSIPGILADEVDDPEDFKPESWVDLAEIDDPDATKVRRILWSCSRSDAQPADWDEDAPLMITDTNAAKPEDWLVDEPEMIPDPDAEKPEEWDDEEDGDWIPPMVPNPKCEEAAGCGPWTQPKIRNPDYKVSHRRSVEGASA